MLTCKSVLIVEDDEDIRAAMEELIQTEGYTTYTAHDGQEALTILESMPEPALIFLDLMMPGMHGWDFLDEREKVPFLRTCPVVLTSAVPEGRALMTERGAFRRVEGMLRKPVMIESVLSVVENHCMPQSQVDLEHARTSA